MTVKLPAHTKVSTEFRESRHSHQLGSHEYYSNTSSESPAVNILIALIWLFVVDGGVQTIVEVSL